MSALESAPSRLTGSPPVASQDVVPESWMVRHAQILWAVLAGFLLLVATIWGWSVKSAGWGPDVLVYLAFLIGLYYGGLAAMDSLREKKLDINLLMVLGALLACVIGRPSEGALLLFLFTLSGALEHDAMQRTEKALSSLMKLFPREALVLEADGTTHLVKLEELLVGQHVLIRTGDQIPADGQVIEGHSSVDESAITGEFLPREKNAGSEVFAGTLNTVGRLVVSVSKPAHDTTLARIIHLVSQAREEKSPAEQLFEKIGSAYTLGVLSLSAMTCLVMGGVLGIPWSEAFYRAITLLIVASPCALIISTPVVMLSAIGRCARRGVVLKGGRHLESLATLKALVFDKTGTLTSGRVQLLGLDLISGSNSLLYRGACRNDALSQDKTRLQLLQVAMSLESSSTHPLAKAVLAYGQHRNLSPLPVEAFHQESGLGLRGRVRGLPAILGSPAMLEKLCHTEDIKDLSQRIAALEAQGQTVVVLYHAGWTCLLRFQDTIRPESAQAIERLHAMKIRPLVMLTGDNRRVAEAVASELGLDEVRAQLLPEEKLAAVEALVQRYGAVGMIGDGINDAPALARATVGIAMGTIGSDAAMQAADVVLLSDRIDRIPWLIGVARSARRRMIENLVFAIGVITVLIISTLFGWVGLPMGVVGHEGSTLLVVLNGLRMLMVKDDR